MDDLLIIVYLIILGVLFSVGFGYLGKSITKSEKDLYDWLQLGVQLVASIVIAIAVLVFSHNYKLKEHQLAKLATLESFLSDIADPDRRLIALKTLELLGYVKEAHTLGNIYFHDDPKVRKEFFTLNPRGMDIKIEMGTGELTEKKKDDVTYPNTLKTESKE